MPSRLIVAALVLILCACSRDVVVLKGGMDVCLAISPPLASAAVMKAAAQVCGEGK